MLACPFAVSDFSDAASDVNLDEIDVFNPGNVDSFTFDKDYKTNDSYLIDKTFTIDGKFNTFYGRFVLDSDTTDGNEIYTVTIKNLIFDGTDSRTFAISAGNQDSDTIRPVNLVLENCTIQNYTGKGMYLTSVQNFQINNCKFINNATGTDDNTKGDYTVDVSLVGITGATISITNCEFSGDCGDKAVIKITQRVGKNMASDDVSTDIDGNKAATISSATLTNNTFYSDNTPVDIMLGSRVSSNTSGAKSYTSAFNVEVISSGETCVARSTGVDQRMDITLSNGSKLVSDGAINEATSSLTGFSAFTLESGSAVISGYIPETATLSIAQAASASVGVSLKSDGMIYTVNNNLSGSVDGKVQNTDVAVNPGYDDDEDLPPYIPSQSSNDDDTVTIVACAAAAAVAAILAVFLVIDRKG